MSLGQYLEKQIKLIAMDTINSIQPLTQTSQNNSTKTGPCTVVSVDSGQTLTVKLDGSVGVITGVVSNNVTIGPGSRGTLLQGSRFV